MKNRRTTTELDLQSNLGDAEIESRRQMEKLSDGVYYIEDVVNIKGEGTSTFALGAGWLLELLELESGEIYFFCGEKEVRPNKNYFGILYPPFTLMRACVTNMKGRLRGIAGTAASFPLKRETVPMIFETDFNEPLNNAGQVEEILNSSNNCQSFEMNPSASLLSVKAKRLIDENYRIYPSIARIASRLGVTHEHLTRQFKHDYSMSPNAYLHQVRVADATFRLSKGEEIIAVSHDVGYNDLSRFYKQFRKATKHSPGGCQMNKGKRRSGR